MTRRKFSTTDVLPRALIDSMRAMFETVDDPRKGKNTSYCFADILMSAFSAFFIQSPSFLSHQRAFHKSNGKNVCGSLFGIQRLPTDNHIRYQLDRIDCSDLYQGFDIAFEELQNNHALRPFQVLDGHTLIALDGSEFHNSREVDCPHCQYRVKKKGKPDQYTEYYHSVLAAALVGPNHRYAVPIRPEFISPQDGDKNRTVKPKPHTAGSIKMHSVTRNSIHFISAMIYMPNNPCARRCLTQVRNSSSGLKPMTTNAVQLPRWHRLADRNHRQKDPWKE